MKPNYQFAVGGQFRGFNPFLARHYTKSLRLAALLLIAGTAGASAQQVPPAANPPAPATGAPNSPTAGKPKTSASQAGTAQKAKAANGSSQLKAVVVSGSAITPSDAAAAKLATIPGGTGLVTTSDVSRGKLATIGDLLKYQAGVFAQSVNGGEATKYSIRGSGLVRTPYSWQTGVQLLVDGLPLTTSAGAPFETIEPLATDHVEVYRGANAWDYGPLSLGGAINFVTHTGYDASEAQARVDFGSYGYEKEQVSSGLVEGPFDYYVSATNYRFEGYRDGSVADSKRLIFNLGYQITPDLNTRFIVRYAQEAQGNPGYLTWKQLQSNPTQSQFAYVTTRVNPGSTVASSITTLNIDGDSTLALGFQYDNFPLRNEGGPTPSQDNWADSSGSLVYTRHDIFFQDTESDTEASVRFTDEISGPLDSISPTGIDSHQEEGGYDVLVTGSNNLEVAKNLWLTTGVSSISQERDDFVNVNALGTSFGEDQHYYNLLGRGGLRYDITPKISVYGNVSQSEEAPILPYLTRSNTASVATSVANLQAQTAITGELGIQGQSGPFDWDLDVYRSWVDHELLTVLIAAPSTTATSNADHTIHQGVEAQLNTTLWQSAPNGTFKRGDEKAEDASRQRIVLRQDYTFSDFTYDNDPTYGNNQLPGVPTNFYQAELRYEHPSGFYASLNTESSISNYQADFANTISVQPYVIFGASIGYAQPKKGLNVYFSVQNIGNEKYAASISPTYNAHGADSAVYSPGLLQSFSGGVSYSF